MANESLVMTAEVRDNFSSTLRKLQNELKALSGTGATSTKTLQKDWKGVGSEIQTAAGTITRDMLPAMRQGNLAGLALGGAIGAAALALKNFAQDTTTISNFSKEIGLASREVAKLQAMGEHFGIDPSTTRANMRNFQDLIQAIEKGSGQAISNLRTTFGRAGDQLAAELLKPGNFERKIELAFQAIRNVDSEPTARKMAQELFGNEAWANAIRNMTPAIEAELKKIALKIDENKEAAAKFNTALFGLQVAAKNLAAEGLTPVLQTTAQLIDKFGSSSIEGFKRSLGVMDGFAKSLANSFKEVAGWLRTFDEFTSSSALGSIVGMLPKPGGAKGGAAPTTADTNRKLDSWNRALGEGAAPGSPAKDIPKTNEDLRQTNEKLKTATEKQTSAFEKFLAIIGQGGDTAGLGPGLGGVSAGGGGLGGGLGGGGFGGGDRMIAPKAGGSLGGTPGAPNRRYGAGRSTPGKITDKYPEGLSDAIKQSASDLGIKAEDLATMMSFETGGTFDPWKRGPTTKWGTHRGLIQWGEPQARQYGVTKDSTVAEQMKAVTRYLRDRGVKPGMSGENVYAAINAGDATKTGASDAAAGGTWGSVADKWRFQMGGHRLRAQRLLNSPGTTGSAAPAPGPTAAEGRRTSVEGADSDLARLKDQAQKIEPPEKPQMEMLRRGLSQIRRSKESTKPEENKDAAPAKKDPDSRRFQLDPDRYKRGELLDLQRKAESGKGAKLEASGTVNIHLNDGLRNANAKVDTDGMFKDVNVNRGRPMSTAEDNPVGRAQAGF